MFRLLGSLVARAWYVLLVGWVVLLVGLYLWAPAWDQASQSGEFAFLPADSPSRRAEAQFDEAFPGERVGSRIVLVVSRSDGELKDADHTFVDGALTPRLRQLLLPGGQPEAGSPVARIHAPGAGPTGALLKSADRRAELIVVDLNTEFLDTKNWSTVASVEQLIGELRDSSATPAGLDVSVAGSAVLGRDTGRAERESAAAVEKWTLIVVIGLLIAVYRAPVLAIIPLLTVAVASAVALRLLGLFSEVWGLSLYQGTKVYVTVVGYGAGVDYCLFVFARSQEAWEAGAETRSGVREAVAKVGPAVTASAGTVITGLAMMGFADFGKISQAGLGISFALAVVLVAALTLAPALLCLAGRWAVWPGRMTPQHSGPTWNERFWTAMGHAIARRPGLVLVATVALMAPFAVVGVTHLSALNYDLTRTMPADAPSSVGLQKLRAHFPAGSTGPLTILLRSDRTDFRTDAGGAAVGELTRRLHARAGELDLADVRSLAEPLGQDPAARATLGRLDPFGAAIAHQQAVKYYVSADGRATRLEVLLTRDPFSASGQEELDALERAVKAELPEALRGGTEVHLLGAPTGMRDMRAVTIADRRRVNFLVVCAVAAVLFVLLRRADIVLYLIVTVLFSYLTTLGLTYLVFAGLEGGEFPGLEWKVPLFLFVILVAVGEDYNIYLVARVGEEVARHGGKAGVIAALGKTGGVLTHCGLIMAGTFATLFAGSLAELRQMGFALSFGVLLDALVVRPVMVPAFLFLRVRWKERTAAQPPAHLTSA
jgi:RND superfamily putative drug exporter